jgi:LmbE family N-acetylglucosaminyl deacetylase
MDHHPMEHKENWEGQKEILVILAHPDDPEFFLGATIARWVKAGHRVRYVLLTKGDKGAKDETLSGDDVAKIRIGEQTKAAESLGVISVDYLDYEDGYLIPDLEMRKNVVWAIRQYKPHILVTCDPDNLFPSQQYINHPDHRNAGQVVLDAVFPAAGNRFFFPELLDKGLDPHEVEEVWMSLTNQPDVTLNVTEHWDDKISALKHHASQIGDPDAFEKRMLERIQESEDLDFRYEEKFRVIRFRRINE